MGKIAQSRHNGPGEGRGGSSPASGPRTLHVGVIYAADGVRELLANMTAEGLRRQLAQYVTQRASDELWPGPAERVLELVRSGRGESAIKLYFEQSGGRWDQERLHRTVIELD